MHRVCLVSTIIYFHSQVHSISLNSLGLCRGSYALQFGRTQLMGYYSHLGVKIFYLLCSVFPYCCCSAFGRQISHEHHLRNSKSRQKAERHYSTVSMMTQTVLLMSKFGSFINLGSSKPYQFVRLAHVIMVCLKSLLILQQATRTLFQFVWIVKWAGVKTWIIF